MRNTPSRAWCLASDNELGFACPATTKTTCVSGPTPDPMSFRLPQCFRYSFWAFVSSTNLNRPRSVGQIRLGHRALSRKLPGNHHLYRVFLAAPLDLETVVTLRNKQSCDQISSTNACVEHLLTSTYNGWPINTVT